MKVLRLGGFLPASILLLFGHPVSAVQATEMAELEELSELLRLTSEMTQMTTQMTRENARLPWYSILEQQ